MRRFRRAAAMAFAVLPPLLLAGCGDSPTDPGSALELDLVSGAPGEVVVGESVFLEVRATERGVPVEGVPVSWDLPVGDGSLTPEAASTGSDGRAGALWRVGETAGSRTLRITGAGAEPLVVETVARAGPAVALRLAPDTLVLTAYRERRRFDEAFLDAYGNAADPPDGSRWEAVDPGVVTVGPDGFVGALEPGLARIAATFGEQADTAFVRVAPRGAVTITFDDGFRSTYTRGAPILRELGLRANVAVNPTAVIEEWPDFMTLEKLEELDQDGWAMVSHTMTHPKLTELSDEELERELAESRAWIEEQGFRGAGVFVVPFHEWGERERAAVERHYEMARGTSVVQFVPDTLAVWIPDDPYAMTAYEAEDAPVTAPEGRALIRDLVERAVAEGRFLELFFHRIPEEMEEGFRLTMEIVAEFLDDVVTYDEALDRFEGSLQAPLVAVAPSGRPSPLRSGPAQNLADQVVQLAHGEGFGEEMERLPGSARLEDRVGIGVARDEDDLDVRAGGPELHDDLGPPRIGKEEVHHHHVDGNGRVPGDAQSVLRAPSGHDVEAAPLEPDGQHVAHAGIVVHQQHVGAGGLGVFLGHAPVHRVGQVWGEGRIPSSPTFRHRSRTTPEPGASGAASSPRAHGSMEVPVSRSLRCYLEGPERPVSAACREALRVAGPQQFYDWHEVSLLDADGRHRELIPDGELCSAGREKYRGLDLPRDDWPAQPLVPDENGRTEFLYRATAPHSTLYFSFYITREGYDPSRPLRWSDLEEEPFCTVADPSFQNGRFHMSCALPEGREGRHLIYNIWQRDDSPEAFYACSDVILGEGAIAEERERARGAGDQRDRGPCGAPGWESDAVYVGGDVVTYEGVAWRAEWWTRGEVPGTTGEWGVWRELGAC